MRCLLNAIQIQDENRISSLVLCPDETQARAYSRSKFAEKFEIGGFSSPVANGTGNAARCDARK
jgi:hypothetical protein